jgi:hypothetical protein
MRADTATCVLSHNAKPPNVPAAERGSEESSETKGTPGENVNDSPGFKTKSPGLIENFPVTQVNVTVLDESSVSVVAVAGNSVLQNETVSEHGNRVWLLLR